MSSAVRLARLDDAAAIRAVYAPYVESTPISFETVVPDVDTMRQRIADVLPRYPWVVFDDGARLVGYAYAHAFAARGAYRWSVETSVYVASDACGRGIGRALYARLMAILVQQGYRRAMAGICLPNPASIALHRSVGFTPVGTYERVGWKFNAWHDVSWWQKGLADGGADGTAPAEPMPLDMLGADELAALLGDG